MKRRTKLPDARLKEGDVTPEIAQGFAGAGAFMYRNNCGLAKFGPRWVRYGVGNPGGSDHIGYFPVRITPEMVGSLVAVFVAAEAKRPVGGEYRKDQVTFIENVRAAGGIAGFVRSWEGARALIDGFHARFPKNTPLRKKAKT